MHPDSPLNPWTLPNVVVLVRLLAIPFFVWTVFSSDTGQGIGIAFLYAAISWTDFIDGMLARLTGQFSRLGVIIDPVADRLLVISGLASCFYFSLLPRSLVVIVAVRELLVIWMSRVALKRKLELKVNWPGRIGILFLLSGIFFALLGPTDTFAIGVFLVGVIAALVSLYLYAREGLRSRNR